MIFGASAVTIIEHIIAPPVSPAAPALVAVRVRWACVAEALAAARGLLAPAHPTAEGALVLAAELLDADTATIECWIECEAVRESIFPPQRAGCEISEAGGCWHLDMRLDGRRILAITIDAATQRIVYCQSNLPAAIGLPGGAYDAPKCQLLAPAK